MVGARKAFSAEVQAATKEKHPLPHVIVFDLGKDGQVAVAKNQGQVMFMSTPNFKFLRLRMSYEKWVKTHGSSQTKSGCRRVV